MAWLPSQLALSWLGYNHVPMNVDSPHCMRVAEVAVLQTVDGSRIAVFQAIILRALTTSLAAARHFLIHQTIKVVAQGTTSHHLDDMTAHLNHRPASLPPHTPPLHR
jgi:hypothetical protein